MICSPKPFSTVLFIVAALFSFITFGAGADARQPLTVVELFTSQGCSSCPPADAHLADLARLDSSEGVLALSFHVDYWNNLGWKDPYSSAENTRRQRAYAQHMDLRYVYTPQMVVQGSLQATGSDRTAIKNQIETARKLPRVDVTLTRDGQEVQVAVAETTRPVEADIYMVVFDSEHVTDIKRGENTGKTITNRNVVRTLKRIGSWDGKSTKLSSPLSEKGDACAVIIQSKKTGAIIGAATMALN
jgi:hypothetical protein